MRSCSRRCTASRPAWWIAAAPRSPSCPSSRRCAIQRATSRTTRWRISIFISKQFESRCTAAGGNVHYAVTADEARTKVLEICRKANARLVTKGKSMIGEEIAINDFLEENGIAPVETDLGEYLVQIRHELPSHIIMPAVHLTQGTDRGGLPPRAHASAGRPQLVEPQTLLTEARVILRDRFLAADVGITGANF
jgi:L-lactate dehydrogenase complex protein LldF